jgi:hypothetical protein
MRLSIGGWSIVGFAVGAFWLWLTFVFFTVPESPLVSVIKVVAAITCPPLLANIYFTAPVLNAAVYAAAAFSWSRFVRR